MTAPYRDDTDSLEARHAALSEELSSVQARTKELDQLKTSEERLAREVADVAKKLEGRAGRRALPLLDSVQIASPCTASWDEMIGDDRARFCTHCQKDVFNLSALPREEAETFLRARTAEVCVRLYKRTDGTVLTSDCPVGVKRKRRRKAVVAAVGGGLLAAGALLQMASRARRADVVMGEMMVEPCPVMGGTGAVPEAPPPVETAVPPPVGPVMGAMPMPPRNPPPHPKAPSKSTVTRSPTPGTAR
ncbi:MAG: hypothetical protein ACMG6S_16505 [Byssovorax sp.]